MTTNEIIVRENTQQPVSLFANMDVFENGQRMAKLLAASDLVPQQFRGNLANTVIALELAQRMGASPLAVMQSTYIVHGKPGWSASFIIAALNSSGRFSPLRFAMTGEGDGLTCVAWAYDLANNERLDGPPVSIGMARSEGWFDKKGSKWKTMPELMLRYRAATLFGRLYAPEILMGMRTADEIVDIGGAVDSPVVQEVEATTGGGDVVDVDAVDINERILTDTGEVVVEPQDGNKGSGTKQPAGGGKKTKPEKREQATPEPGRSSAGKGSGRDGKNGGDNDAVIAKFRKEIDAIDTSLKLDRWRMKHHKRICRELPDEAGQDAVMSYAQQRYLELQAAEKEPATADKARERFYDCPDEKNGMVPESYCDTECSSRKGCPAHE